MRLHLGRRLPFMPTLTVPLAIVLVPCSVFGQVSNYVFNSGGVSSSATSMSNGTYGTGYLVSGSVGSSGFTDNGESKIDTKDSSGNIISAAKGTSQNATKAFTSALGVTLDISSVASSFADAENYYYTYASSAGIYKPPTWHDGTGMSMAWNVNIASTLTATSLHGATSEVLNGGTAFEDASWTITVMTPSGSILAIYDELTNGSSFSVRIPANTIVWIQWQAITDAKASSNLFVSSQSASASASVTGTVAITPSP